MTNPEIRKLLAGYATNSLTEAERKSLFEAALHDQELFDQLHGEQAVKDVLDDPVSRAQIRKALDEPVPASRAWWTRWWAWTGAAVAVAASIVVVSVIRPRPPDLGKEMASLKSAPTPQVPSPAATAPSDSESKREAPRLISVPRRAKTAGAANVDASHKSPNPAITQNERKDLPPPPALPAPSAPPQSQVAEQVQVVPTQRQAVPESVGRVGDQQFQTQQAPVQMSKSLSNEKQTQTINAEFGGAASNFVGGVAGSPLRYNVVKLNDAGAYAPVPANTPLQPGDSVRFIVTPMQSGYLFLSHLDPSSVSSPVRAETSQGIPVTAFNSYTIPDTAIQIQPTNQRYRITLVPSEVQRSKKSSEGAREASPQRAIKAKTGAATAQPTNPSPFVVEINLGPTNIH